MVRAKLQNNILHFAGAVFLILSSAIIFSSAQASARPLSDAKNRYEQERSALCSTDPADYSIYGIVWVNDNPQSAVDNTRWEIDLVVPWDAGVIDATMWTTAANCPDNGAPRTGSRIFGLAPAAGGNVPLSFPYGTSINRGDSIPGHYADPPGSLRVRLDVTGKAMPGAGRDCGHSVAYRGTYEDSRATGASNIFVNQLCITRQARPQPNWTQVVSSTVSPSTLQPGQTAKFDHYFRNDGPDHSRNWIYITRYKNKDASGRILDQGDISSLSNTSGSANLAPGDFRNKIDNFVIPNSWTAGYQRCEYILIDSYKSPIPNPSERRSSEVCVTVASSNGAAPTGTISTVCTTSTQGQVTITFQDSNGPTDAYITVGGSPPYTTATTTPYTYNAVPIPNSGSTSVQLFVKDVGTGGFNQYKNVASGTLSNANCAAPALDPNCTDPQDSVTVQPTSRPSPSSGYSYVPSAPSGSTTQRSARVATLSPGAGYRIDSARDQYTPSPTPATWSPAGRQTGPNFTLDYNNYKTQYPYDSHDTTVSYTEWWSEQRYYTNSTPDFYTCNSGDSLSGTTCTHYYTEYTSGTRTCTYNPSTGNNDCTPYTCPSGYSGGGSSSTCSRPASNTYTATSNYNWRTGSSGERSSTASMGVGQGGITRLPECYQRTFNVHEMSDSPSTSASVRMTPDTEDPTRATFGGTVYVDFGYNPAATSPAGLRNANRVTLNWAATYYIVQAGEPTDPSNGDPFPFACGLPASGTVTVNGRNTASDNESANISVPPCNANFMPPLKAGDRVCVSYVIAPKGSTINQSGQISNNNGITVRTHDCGPVLADQPYVHILGQDASAGGSFANGLHDQCASAALTNGSISANYKTSGALTRGSGSQYAAMAQGIIAGFTSGTLKTSNPTAEKGLTFANISTTGNLGAPHCVPDYFSTQPGNIQTLSSGNLNQFNGAGRSGAYDFTGNLTLTRPGSGFGTGIQKGNRITIYVSGDVFIEKNIEFKKTGWITTTDIPSFYVIAKGNIYIAPDVTELDGVYVAQPTGAGGGTINTCAPGFGRFSAAILYDNCKNNKLMVNGAFVARNINFLRTFSSLRTSLGGEQPITANNVGPCNGNTRAGTRPSFDTNHDCAAEIINFSPETYLSEPSMLPVGGPAVNRYDYITSLSPVL